jgi:putative transposase
MAKRGHGEEEILRVLREAESGDTVVAVCRKHGISQQTFYLWKKKYAVCGVGIAGAARAATVARLGKRCAFPTFPPHGDCRDLRKEQPPLHPIA